MGRLSLLLLLVLCLSAFSQDDAEYTRIEYQERAAKFQKMKVGGIVLLSGGILCIVSGILMVASTGSASYQVNYTNGKRTESGDPVGGFGGVLTVLGIPMTAGGIVLAKIGSNKVTEAKSELQQSRHLLRLKFGRDRIALSYSF